MQIMTNTNVQPNIDFGAVKTPCFVVDRRLLEKNLKILDGVQKRTGCRILLAQKGFSMYSLYPEIVGVSLRHDCKLAPRGTAGP